jgi:hypothetical protein
MAEMLIIWALVPFGLFLLCFGVGTLIGSIGHPSKNLAQIVVVGFLGTVVVGSLVVLNSNLSKYASALLGLLGVAGLCLAFVKKAWPSKTDSPFALAGTLTYLVFSLPALDYGKPTWAGWVQLDDNSSWYAITNRLMTLGHSIPNPVLTTYDRVLQVYLGGNQFNYGGSNNGQFSYPTGALIPFGAMSKLSRVELAWLFQPYLAFCAALISMLFVLILRRRIQKKSHLIFGAVLASSASTYFSYAMWGGIKEIVLLIPVTYFAITFFGSLERKFHWRNYIYSLLGLIALYFIGEKTSFAFVLPMLVVGILVEAHRRGPKYLRGASGVMALLVFFALFS